MREIKFRGKIKSRAGTTIVGLEGTWFFGDLEIHRKDDRVLIHCYDEDGNYYRQYDVDKETLGQYTGMKDKYGKEIYEGDIVTMEDFGFTRERPLIVVYDNFDAGFKFRGVYCLVTPNSKCEVIGNIEDNPNLIPID